MKKICLFSILLLDNILLIKAQNIQWTGERDANGRARVSDDLVKRLANISLEEACGYVRNKGYNNQFDAMMKERNG